MTVTVRPSEVVAATVVTVMKEAVYRSLLRYDQTDISSSLSPAEQEKLPTLLIQVRVAVGVLNATFLIKSLQFTVGAPALNGRPRHGIVSASHRLGVHTTHHPQ